MIQTIAAWCPEPQTGNLQSNCYLFAEMFWAATWVTHEVTNPSSEPEENEKHWANTQCSQLQVSGYQPAH